MKKISKKIKKSPLTIKNLLQAEKGIVMTLILEASIRYNKKHKG